LYWIVVIESSILCSMRFRYEQKCQRSPLDEVLSWHLSSLSFCFKDSVEVSSLAMIEFIQEETDLQTVFWLEHGSKNALNEKNADKNLYRKCDENTENYTCYQNNPRVSQVYSDIVSTWKDTQVPKDSITIWNSLPECLFHLYLMTDLYSKGHH
jgi:hypothetical protein